MTDTQTPGDAQAQPPRVVLILQDNQETGELDVGGVQSPQEFNPRSAAHVVGKFLAENLEQIILAAAHQVSERAKADQPTIIGQDRERTIITETGRRDLLADES